VPTILSRLLMVALVYSRKKPIRYIIVYVSVRMHHIQLDNDIKCFRFLLKPVQQIQFWLTLNLLTTTIVAPPSNASKWHMGFNSAFRPLNAELNPICHLLALLGSATIVVVSRLSVKGLNSDKNVRYFS